MGLLSLYSRTKRSIGMALIAYGGRLAGDLPKNFLSESGVQWSEVSVQARYEAMIAYYRSNNLYEWINEIARKKNLKGWEAKPLKNPVPRIIEFHGTHLWPGKLPEAMPLSEPFAYQEYLEQVWEWSNWSQQKQVAARRFAMLGDMFLKVSTKMEIDFEATATNLQDFPPVEGEERPPVMAITRVYIQLIEPSTVTDYTKDERGFFQTLRLDIPIESADGSPLWHTEFWDKNSYRIYLQNRGPEEPEEKLSQYFQEEIFLSEIMPGMNFIPFTHAKNLDDGSERGWPMPWASIQKIDELNRHATRLYQMCFRHNKPLWAAMANNPGGNGRIAAPSFANASGEVDVWEDGDVLELPGMSSLESLAPKIDWKAALDIIKDIEHQIRQDFPELIYYDLQTQANVATDTIVKWMAPAIDRANEARQAAETALIQAQTMALSIGAAAGLFPKITEGAYEAGKLKHAFADRPILIETSLDAALTAKAWTDIGLPMASALRIVGFSESEIEVIIKEQEADTKRKGASLTQSLIAARSSFEAGDQPGEPRDPDLGQ